MRRAAIVSPLRTAVGPFGGALRDVPVADLAVPEGTLERPDHVKVALMEREPEQ